MKFKPKHERKFWRMAGATPVASRQFNDGMAEVARLFQALQPRLTVNVDDKQYRHYRGADRQSRIPAVYVPASWRNTTPVDDGANEIGIGFETRDGIVRLCLSMDSAECLVASVADYINSYTCRTHTDGAAAVPEKEIRAADGIRRQFQPTVLPHAWYEQVSIDQTAVLSGTACRSDPPDPSPIEAHERCDPKPSE